MRLLHSVTPFAALALILSAPAALTAQAAQPRLGTVSFPTTAVPAAQAHFLRGVLFLHSFEYDKAAEAFRAAQQVQPDFVLAYWGEAMTYNHPIWNQRDRAAALAALERLAPTREARLARARDERARAFLEAVEILYEEGPKPQRDTAYAEAMARVAGWYPDDVESQSFYALSLLGLSQGVRVVPTYMRAAAIAQSLFFQNPDHPGLAHYLIHAFDDPTHAPLGLQAARAYSRIAPDAAHAQHMTTHIFLALGMWDEVVSQNILSRDLTSSGPTHYTAWLQYGLEQQGRFADARAVLNEARRVLGEGRSRGSLYYLTAMRAHHLINTEQWDAAAPGAALGWPVDLSGAAPVAEAIDAFALGLAAIRRGDGQSMAPAMARLTAVAGATDGGAVPKVLLKELQGVAALSQGKNEAALLLLREATVLEDAMPVEFGPPDVVKPSHELLGEALLQLGQARPAQRAFERALELAPGRALALRGLVEAANRAGDLRAAERAAAQLKAIRQKADPAVSAAVGG